MNPLSAENTGSTSSTGDSQDLDLPGGRMSVGQAGIATPRYVSLLQRAATIALPLSLSVPAVSGNEQLPTYREPVTASIAPTNSADVSSDSFPQTSPYHVVDADPATGEAMASLEDIRHRSLVHGEHQTDVVRSELAQFLARYGTSGIQAIGDTVFSQRQSSEFDWICIEFLGVNENSQMAAARRRILQISLVARDPALRYSGAVGLGLLADEAALEALRDRLPLERNPTVQAMINAQLSAS